MNTAVPANTQTAPTVYVKQARAHRPTHLGMSAIMASASLCLVGIESASAVPPTLFSQAAYESPVRGDPGDLLMIAGAGFAATDTVVYQALDDTTQPLSAPAETPTTSDASGGIAPVVSVRNVPHSLTVVLPEAIRTDQSYALWVRNANGEWSNGVRINDARPLWITPDSAYITAATANLPRYLKVVGRNLQPAPGATTQVRLTGPNTYTLPAENDGNPATAIERYVAQITLPMDLPPGSYTVQLSRDGVSWLPVGDQTLSVFPDPVAPREFPVGAYGGCVPDDGVDDTPCIVKAIAAARSNGGGSVTFGPGVWNMGNDTQAGVVYFGVLVPVGVNLAGAGQGSTTVQRDTTWDMQKPIFTLQGNNIVQGFTFKDAFTYQPSSPGRMLLLLGVAPDVAQAYNANDPSYVSGVTITDNTFDKPFVGIQDGGMPIDHLFVTHNEFGAYSTGLLIDGDLNLTDSVVGYNTFLPGSYIDVAAGQGAIPTGFSAGHRFDFSNNSADGAATRYLYDPVGDPKGFRAAFLWAMRGSHEKVLVSHNTATCSGDKAGDGEAFSYDNNHNSGALPAAQPALAATADTVTVQGPLVAQTDGTAYPAGHYVDFWVTIAQGPGQGQVRRIVSYSGSGAAPTTFNVSPAWDVVPQTTSLVTVAKEFWQVYTVDNFVDQRQPLCQKSNANRPAGGVIALYAQTADSAVEGNLQYDTSGIQLGLGYTVHDPLYQTEPATMFQTFVEVRGNTIDGEYSWPSDCSFSGIWPSYAATPTAGFPPPIEGYGISISHNTITQADGFHNGAVAFTRGWFPGPAPSTWDVVENSLVFGNSISNITLPAPSHVPQWPGCAANQSARVGAHIEDGLVWHTVFHANSCHNVARSFIDGGTASKRVCPTGVVDSCECSSYVQGTSASSQAPLSSSPVTYQAAQAAGNLNVVVVGWGDSTSQVASVTDSAGNAYALATGPTRSAGNASQSIYYAKNIVGAASNVVTVTFNTPVPSSVIRITEYSGTDMESPFDAGTGVSSSTDSTNGGSVTTANPDDLLIEASYVAADAVSSCPQSGQTQSIGVPHYMQRMADGANAGMLGDTVVTATGVYSPATPACAGSGWIAQLVAFKLAGGSDSNTQALTAPGNLAAAAAVTEIDLSWTASTDNIGVTGYLVERCQGVGCTNFTQIAGATGTAYSDTALANSATYTYRVRATDVASLMSGYSNTVTATTSAGP